MRKKVYIDGQEGTTGLKIIERFNNRDDIEILRIDEDKRKDLAQRKKLINSSDYTFLCLPDVASIEAVSLVENENVKIIDASTAHRTNPEWVYGFPELSKEHREKIAQSKRVAVPGCYASGFVSLAYPLVKASIISKDAAITSHALSGYSGGGKKMIAQYTGDNFKEEYLSPRQYALTQQHKHQKEMQIISGLDFKPMFNPIVANYFCGMVVSIPLITRTLAKKVSPQEICSVLKQH
ncbi:MAG: N-acetyl-gamma-glutamyl-phosphate reductase, partial [Oscillospiraceae bacterium]